MQQFFFLNIKIKFFGTRLTNSRTRLTLKNSVVIFLASDTYAASLTSAASETSMASRTYKTLYHSKNFWYWWFHHPCTVADLIRFEVIRLVFYLNSNLLKLSFMVLFICKKHLIKLKEGFCEEILKRHCHSHSGFYHFTLYNTKE